MLKYESTKLVFYGNLYGYLWQSLIRVDSNKIRMLGLVIFQIIIVLSSLFIVFSNNL